MCLVPGGVKKKKCKISGFCSQNHLGTYICYIYTGEFSPLVRITKSEDQILSVRQKCCANFGILTPTPPPPPGPNPVIFGPRGFLAKKNSSQFMGFESQTPRDLNRLSIVDFGLQGLFDQKTAQI